MESVHLLLRQFVFDPKDNDKEKRLHVENVVFTVDQLDNQDMKR